MPLNMLTPPHPPVYHENATIMPLINARSVSNIILGRDSVRRGERPSRVVSVNAVLRVWEIEGKRGFMQITSDTCHFWGGPATQFANNALIRIIKITQESEYRIKVYGWVLSGAGTYMMKGKQGPYFRSYPFWSYITIHNYKRFRLLPYRKKEK